MDKNIISVIIGAIIWIIIVVKITENKNKKKKKYNDFIEKSEKVNQLIYIPYKDFYTLYLHDPTVWIFEENKLYKKFLTKQTEDKSNMYQIAFSFSDYKRYLNFLGETSGVKANSESNEALTDFLHCRVIDSSNAITNQDKEIENKQQPNKTKEEPINVVNITKIEYKNK